MAGITLQAESGQTVTMNAGAANAAMLDLGPGQSAAVSGAGVGRIRYNATLNRFELSENGAAYADILTSAQVGWVDDGGTVRLDTAADVVAIGTATATAGRKLTILETANDAGIRVEVDTAGNNVVDAIVTGDSAARYQVLASTAGGEVRLSSGAATADVSFRRTGVRSMIFDHGAGTSGAFVISFGVEATTSTLQGSAATTAATAGTAISLAGGAGQTTAAGGASGIAGGQGGATGIGGAATVTGGAGGTTSGAGGAITLQGGTATDGDGGAATLAGRNGVAGGAAARAGGAVNLTAGNAAAAVNTQQAGAAITLTGGNAAQNGTGTAVVGGAISGTAGNGAGAGAGGAITWTGGTGNGSAAGGVVALVGGTGGASNGAGADARVVGGSGGVTNGNGGNVSIEAGVLAGSGADGIVTFRVNGAARTPNVVPRADAEGSLGTAALRWNLIRGVTITSGTILEEEVFDSERLSRSAMKARLRALLQPGSLVLPDGSAGRHLPEIAMLAAHLLV